MDIDLGNITIPNIDVDVGDFDFGSLPQYLEYDTDGDGVLNDAEYASYMEALTAWAEATNTDVSDDTYVPPEQTVGEVEDALSGLSDSNTDVTLAALDAIDRLAAGPSTVDWFFALPSEVQSVVFYGMGILNIPTTVVTSGLADPQERSQFEQAYGNSLNSGISIDPGIRAAFGPLAQNRSRNAVARGELRDRRQFVNGLVSDEGYTREQARHIYYEYIGARSENPNKTLSDAQIDQLYGDYQAGNTPNAVAAAEEAEAAAEAERQRLAEEEAARIAAEEEAERQRLAEEAAEEERQQQEAAARQEALDNADSIFRTAGYNPSAEEIETFADNPEGIPAYVNPRQVTAQEAARIFQDTYGYEPNAYEIQEFMGQGDENFQANQQTAIGEYVDPRQVTREELEAIAAEQGYTLDEDDYKKYVGQTNNPEDDDYDRRISTLADVELDANAVTEEELEAIAAEQGFDLSELNEEEKAKLLGNVVEEDIIQQLDDKAVTRAELEDIAREQNFDLANIGEEEIDQLVGNVDEADVINNIDSRAVNIADVIEIYKDQVGEDIDEETALQILMSAGYPVGENGELLPGGPNEETFKEYIGNVEMSFEERMKLFLDKASKFGQNVLDLLFGKHPTGRSKTLIEIWEEQRERLLPPSPLDPDYEKKMVEWIKNRSGSIISINHEPIINSAGQLVHDIWAGLRFPVPLPIIGPEIKVPLVDENGNFIGVGAAAGLFIDELGNVVDEAGRRVGQIASTGIQLVSEAGEVLRTIPLTLTGTDEYGNPEYGVEDWEEGDPNPFELDENGDGVVDQQFDDNGNPIDPNTGLPVIEQPDEGDEGDDTGDTGDTGDTVDDIPEGDRVAYLSDVVAAKEEVLDTLGGQLEALGLDVDEVKNILDGVQEQLDGVATAEDLEALRGDLTQTITDELAALGIDDIQGTLDAVGEDLDSLNTSLNDLSRAVGLPAREDDPDTEEDESRPATGIYAAIEEGDAVVKEYIDGLVEDIASLGVDVAAIPGLIEGIIESTSAELEALGLNQQQIIDLLGSPATDDAAATGLYATIDDLAAEVEEDLAGLTTDLGDLSDRVGAPAEYDDEGNLVSESTGLYAEIDDLVAEGVSRDEAIDQVLSDLATAYDTNTETLLTALGTTEDAIREDIAGVAEDVAGLTEDVAGVKEDVAGLADDVDNIDTRIDDLVEAGVEQTEAINTAIAELSDKYDLSTKEILDAISDSESRLSTQIGLPARVDDPDTEEDESRPATGLYAQIGAAEATITADISDLSDLVTAYEEAGLSRDEALAAAITDLSAQLGLTEERFLTSLGETELSIQTSIDEAEANIQASIEAAEATITADISDLTDLVMAYEAAGISRDEALTLAINDVAANLNLTRAELLEYIGETETSIKDAIDASQTETNQYLDYISGVIGRPATDITQDDIDMVVDMLAEDEFLSDYSNDMRMYDVNFDGRIDNTDIEILQGYADIGVEGIGEIPATGLYGDAARRQEEITGYISDEQEITRGLIQEQAEETRRFVGAQNFLNAALSSGDFAGRKVDVTTPDPVELKYIYGFEDIFATPQQRGLFPSPYGAPQRQAAQQIAQQRGIMSGPLQLGGLQRQPGMAAGGKVDYDFTDEIMHIMSYGDS